MFSFFKALNFTISRKSLYTSAKTKKTKQEKKHKTKYFMSLPQNIWTYLPECLCTHSVWLLHLPDCWFWLLFREFSCMICFETVSCQPCQFCLRPWMPDCTWALVCLLNSRFEPDSVVWSNFWFQFLLGWKFAAAVIFNCLYNYIFYKTKMNLSAWQ